MTVFVADHTGQLDDSTSHLRPIHIGAALASPGSVGPEPDTTVPGTLSALPVFADLRLYDYVSKAYAGRCDYVCIQQYRRQFFLGRPRRWQRSLMSLQARVSSADGGQVEVSAGERDAYLRHLGRVSERSLRRELGGHDFIANRWSFGETTVEDQYLGSIADTYPGQPAYIEAWHDLRAVLGTVVPASTIDGALLATSGYFNNCFITSWDEFDRYNRFLFEVLDGLKDYRGVYRLYGYLAERVFCVYLAHQVVQRKDFTVQSRPMMVVA